jgi:acetyl-CoA carboxylase biotin carboxyl carrier protein
MIDLRYVKKLIEMLDESSVDSVEISSEKGVKIRLSKSPVARGAVPVAAPVALPAALAPLDPPRATPPAGVPAPEVAAPTPVAARPASRLEIKSPMVGTFYTAAEPGAKPYAAVGDRVRKGQVVCIIEAMKIMNEIESEFDGVVTEVLADNAHPVEYGQVLFRVDANG